MLNQTFSVVSDQNPIHSGLKKKSGGTDSHHCKSLDSGMAAFRALNNIIRSSYIF